MEREFRLEASSVKGEGGFSGRLLRPYSSGLAMTVEGLPHVIVRSDSFDKQNEVYGCIDDVKRPRLELLHGVNPHPAYPQIMVGVDGRMRDAVFLYLAFFKSTSQTVSLLRRL